MKEHEVNNAISDFLDNNHTRSYARDLNAIAMAEQELTGPQRDIYVHRLLSIGTPFQAMTATAEQRAKELLKTIGRWKD